MSSGVLPIEFLLRLIEPAVLETSLKQIWSRAIIGVAPLPCIFLKDVTVES